jgi:hypothetical protein
MFCMLKYLHAALLLYVIGNMFILKPDFGKGKVAPVHAVGIRGRGGSAPLILNLCTR